MYPPSQAAYDRAITVFSPDGRLFQVEYAREAVKTGSTSIAVVAKDGIVIVAQRRISSPLMVGDSYQKIFQLDQHLAASSSGLVADGRKLIDYARLECQKHRLTYNEPISVEMLAKKLGDYVQFFTQYAGVRPFGVSLLLAGADGGMRLFETDPSGALFEYKATAIGAGKKAVEEMFEKEYKDTITINEAVKLSLKALKKVSEEKLTPELVEITVIPRDNKRVRFLKGEEVAAFFGGGERSERA